MSKESVAGHRVPRPADAVGALTVYLNGREVTEGVEFDLEPDALVFREPLYRRKTGFLGRLQMTTVGIGVYDRVDKVDIHCTAPDGAFRFFPDLEVEPGT